jgi:hypothetical protein
MENVTLEEISLTLDGVVTKFATVEAPAQDSIARNYLFLLEPPAGIEPATC